MIDTHLHLWNPAHFQYPWLGGVPALNREFTLQEYRQMASEEVTGSLFVECAAGSDSSFAEALWALDLASQPESAIEGVVASVWPERPDFEENLSRLAGHPKLKGIRRILHTEPDELSRSPLFRSNVSSLAARRLSFDLCVLERQLPLAISLVDACPDTQFILDHCGVPDIAAGSPGFWREQMTELAERPNVACKVSGLLLYAAEHQRTGGGVFPYFAHVCEEFGWERLLWGGDWPVCTLAAPLRSWMQVTHELLDLADAIPSQRAAFLSENAKTLYRL